MKPRFGLRIPASAPALLAACGALALWTAPAGAEVNFSYSGYIREHVSVNLQNSPEVVYPVREGESMGLGSRFGEDNFDAIGGKGQLSMARTTLKLDGLLDLGFAQVVGVGRVVREHHTEFEKKLQRAGYANVFTIYDGGFKPSQGLAGALNLPVARGFQVATDLTRDGANATNLAALAAVTGAGGPGYAVVSGGDLGLHMHKGAVFEQYDSEELRELYVQFDVGQRNHFRLGRQQVVWGESDFFRGMDIIHGYDLRWRLFLELENEELRKPLILFNYSRDIPQIGGALQLLLRPGWDAGSDVGDELPLSGGRWGPQPLRGVNALSLSPYNYHHCSGDENDLNYGGRLAGVIKQINYSLNYYRGPSQSPVLNRNPRLGGSPGIGCFEGKIGTGGRVQNMDGSNTPESTGNDLTLIGEPFETVFPMVDTFGITANAYNSFLDVVAHAEVAYTPNQPYNAGANTWISIPYFYLGYSDAENGPGPDSRPSKNYFNVGGGAVNSTILFGNDSPVLYDTSAGDAKGKDGAPANCDACLYFPGARKVHENQTLKLSMGTDKQVYGTTRWFGTQRPGLWLLQVFDQWVLDYDKDDELLELPGYGATRREHTVYMTNALNLNYRYDTINPGIAHGVDLGNFDQFLLPFLDLVYGDHWRIHTEVSLFFAKHTNEAVGNNRDRDTRLLGALGNRDQATMRITYQF